MNNYTTAHAPLRFSEIVDVLVRQINGEITRSGQGQFMEVKRLSSAEKFSYVSEHIDDTYEWGAFSIKRHGVQTTLTHLETGEEKKFYIAGDVNIDIINGFMDSLTDDQLMAFFSKKERQKKVTSV